MISIGKLTSVEQAVRYLREAVAQQQLEYYTARGESPGRWNGPGAEVLGVRGEVIDTDFAAVLAGTHPRTGEELGKHWRRQSVVAFDVTVSAPKDVSILYALGDERTRSTILRIHGEGVQAAAEYLQANAGWARRYNADIKTTEAVRAKLVMPEFVHRTARPVTDPTTGTVTVDPQLHTHITVPTWVQRPDGSWSQLHSEPLYQHAAAAGAIAQAEWRDRLVRELGVSTVVDGKGCFSIVGITVAQRREFSRRSLQIDAAASAYDVTTRSGREVVTLDTREGKHEVAATEDLFARWHERAASVGLDGVSMEALLRRESGGLEPRRLDVQRSVDILGVHGLTARQATFTRRDLIRAVASHAPLGMSRRQLEATVDWMLADRSAVEPLPPRLRDGETEREAMLRWSESGHDLRYTTPEMLALERGMVATAQARAGAGVGMARADTVAAAMATRRTLTRDQRTMIEEVCLSPGGVLVIEGDAGVGKTYALEVCREAFDASGVEVVGCALAGRAAELLEEGSDIASTTVAATLQQLQVERLPYGGVLVVDEAGMLGDRQLAELVSLAARDEAKLVVVGDPFQLQPIEAGAPMRTLSDHIGRVELHENIRQHYDWERATLQLLRDGEARAAYREYERYDRIHDAHSVAERRVQVIEDHARLEAGGLNTVILARRRDEVAALNELAHARSVAEGRVHGPALTVGDKEYQVGDRVICLANERSGAVSNGTRGIVTAVDVERQILTLERPDKRQLTLDTTHYDAIDRGYALTVHKAQGMTADIALVVGSEGATREWAYTAMSRATLATHYYEVFTPPERDTLGVEHWKETSRSAEERTVQAWTRSELKESALDYPERYETPDRITVEDDLRDLATDRQRALVEMLGGSELAQEATREEAGEEIDRLVAQRAYDHVERLLRGRGMSEDATRERLARAVERIKAEDAAGGPHNHSGGKAVAGWLTPEIDAQLEAAQLEFERGQGTSPDVAPW
jgi:conjugative relaxase-like TrwC/TraI family protein